MKRAMGWVPDLPDNRDFTHEHDNVVRITGSDVSPQNNMPAVDLSQWCPPVYDQDRLGSCTANAAAGLVSYYERRAFNTYLDPSRLFLYKASRDLDGTTGDVGSQLRTVMKALVMFGAPPESMWPYDEAKFDVEPSAMLYAMASNYKAATYFRLDQHNLKPADVLANVKRHLAMGLPSIFGFTVYSSMPGCGAADDGSGNIPMPTRGDSVQGGHAVMAVGYDSARKIGTETGAIKIRNSWGTGVGEKGTGYFWLPEKYILEGIADDFWTLIKANFVDTALFE